MLNPKAGHIVHMLQCHCGGTFTRITEKTARNDLPDCPLRRCIHDLPRMQAHAATQRFAFGPLVRLDGCSDVGLCLLYLLLVGPPARSIQPAFDTHSRTATSYDVAAAKPLNHYQVWESAQPSPETNGPARFDPLTSAWGRFICTAHCLSSAHV